MYFSLLRKIPFTFISDKLNMLYINFFFYIVEYSENVCANNKFCFILLENLQLIKTMFTNKSRRVWDKSERVNECKDVGVFMKNVLI